MLVARAQGPRSLARGVESALRAVRNTGLCGGGRTPEGWKWGGGYRPSPVFCDAFKTEDGGTQNWPLSVMKKTDTNLQLVDKQLLEI